MIRRSLALTAVVLLVVAGHAQAGLTTNLVGYWTFDGDGRDSSGRGYDLELHGSGVLFDTGLFGQGLSLRGDTSKYAARPVDDPIYDFGSNDFTVQVWVNFNNISGEQVLIEKFDGPSNPGWTLSKGYGGNPTAWLFWAQPNSAVLNSSSQTIDTDVWHQVMIRRQGAQFDLFCDGIIVAQASNSNPVPDTDMPLLIGKRNEHSNQGFAVDGRIDETAIWTRALSNNEVAYLYNGGAGNPIVPEPCTLIVWSLLGASGVTIGWSRRRKRAG